MVTKERLVQYKADIKNIELKIWEAIAKRLGFPKNTRRRMIDETRYCDDQLAILESGGSIDEQAFEARMLESERFFSWDKVPPEQNIIVKEAPEQNGITKEMIIQMKSGIVGMVNMVEQAKLNGTNFPEEAMQRMLDEIRYCDEQLAILESGGAVNKKAFAAHILESKRFFSPEPKDPFETIMGAVDDLMVLAKM